MRLSLARFTVILPFLITAAVTAQSPEQVVVWVHGLFSGNGFPYASEFEKLGFHNIIAAIGPVSSNWDRACELYAQIKGTVVDYGVCHSREAGHNRFGIDYTGKGLYPQWDANNRVHFIGHSMGGQTIRMLEMLLQEGSGCEKDTSPLFTGSGNWMRSVTTMNTPHDGTTLIGLLGDGIIDFLKNIIIGFAGSTDETSFDALIDLKLDHWDMKKEQGEGFRSYWNRLKALVLRNDNLDFATFSVSEEGARIQNNFGLQTYPNTYYMSFAAEKTKPKRTCLFLVWCRDYEVPEDDMSLFLYVTARLMGQNSLPAQKRKNDGVVHWESMKCPTSNNQGKSNCRQYNGYWKPNQWNWIDVPYLDHLQITHVNTWNDIFNYDKSAKKLHVDHAHRIIALNDGNLEFSFKSYDGLDGEVVDMSAYDQNPKILQWQKASVASSVLMSFLIGSAIFFTSRTLRRRFKRRQTVSDACEVLNEVHHGDNKPNSNANFRRSILDSFYSRKKNMSNESEVSL